MRLYGKAIPTIAHDIIQRLIDDEDIEVEPMRLHEAEQDVAAILRQYLADETQVLRDTEETLSRRGYDRSSFGRVKREMAEARGHRLGDEGTDYIIEQILEFLLISRNVEEVFSEDRIMRKKVFQVFQRHLEVDAELDRDARARLRHLEEGTPAWEIEYRKQIEQLRRLKGLI